MKPIKYILFGSIALIFFWFPLVFALYDALTTQKTLVEAVRCEWGRWISAMEVNTL
jgi:membrane-anchored glycerophosphoryl diester phosphodiesterase (GDPDase)